MEGSTVRNFLVQKHMTRNDSVPDFIVVVPDFIVRVRNFILREQQSVDAELSCPSLWN